jgi:hypothetical protein
MSWIVSTAQPPPTSMLPCPSFHRVREAPDVPDGQSCVSSSKTRSANTVSQLPVSNNSNRRLLASSENIRSTLAFQAQLQLVIWPENCVGCKLRNSHATTLRGSKVHSRTITGTVTDRVSIYTLSVRWNSVPAEADLAATCGHSVPWLTLALSHPKSTVPVFYPLAYTGQTCLLL